MSVAFSDLLPEIVSTNKDDCPLFDKTRHVTTAAGVCGTATWALRRAGVPVDLSALLPESVSADESYSYTDAPLLSLKVRFQDCDRCGVLAEVDGEITDAATGAVQFPLPAAVCQHAGVYSFSAAVLQEDRPILIDSGLVSVEPSLWGDPNQLTGPPSLEEIRLHLRDRAAENTLLGAVEFSDVEILEAIRWPVHEFNESPPPLPYYNCRTFPWRYNWLNAIVGRLLQSAVHAYLRNKLQATGANLAVNSLDKDDAYLRLAKSYRDEWQLFIREKKCQLNAGLAWGSI